MLKGDISNNTENQKWAKEYVVGDNEILTISRDLDQDPKIPYQLFHYFFVTNSN